MNPKVVRSVVLFLAAAAAAFAADSATKPYAFRVGETRGFSVVTAGASEGEVLRALGVPSRLGSDKVWVYPRYHARETAAAELRGCTILVVTFVKRQVTDMKLVNEPAAKSIASAAAAGRSVAFVADTQGSTIAGVP